MNAVQISLEQAIARVRQCSPSPLNDALEDLAARLLDTGASPALATWIVLLEHIYPRPWPDPSAEIPQSPRPSGLPPQFNFRRWAEIVASVQERFGDIELDQWRALFEHFLAMPELSVEGALDFISQLRARPNVQRTTRP